MDKCPFSDEELPTVIMALQLGCDPPRKMLDCELWMVDDNWEKTCGKLCASDMYEEIFPKSVDDPAASWNEYRRHLWDNAAGCYHE